MKSIANKFHLIMLAALSLTACKKDSTVIEIANDDPAIIKVKESDGEYRAVGCTEFESGQKLVEIKIRR